MGGTNDKSNLITVTEAQHAHLHKILYDVNGHWQDYCAWKALSGRIGKEEILRLKQASNKGKEFSEEHKKKISESKKGKSLSEETKKKISESQSGKIRSTEHAKNNTKSRKENGKPWHDSDTKNKIAESVKNMPKKKCPYCDKVMGLSNLAYHIKRKHQS